MTAPLWLPPLNIPCKNVEITVPDSSPISSLSSSIPEDVETKSRLEITFEITVQVRVRFQSKTADAPLFVGLDYLTKAIFIPFRELISCPLEKAEKIFRSRFSEDLGIPPQFCRDLFVQESHDNAVVGESQSDYSSAKRIWFSAFINRLRSLIHENIGGGGGGCQVILPITVTIERMSKISDDLHRAWLCWYDHSKKLNPEFEKEYNAAISRPRTAEELSRESVYLSFDQALITTLKDVDVSNSSGDDINGGLADVCSICLDELSNQKRGSIKSLSCSHIFHGDCIKQWLRRNQICPLCRDSLPFRMVKTDSAIMK